MTDQNTYAYGYARMPRVIRKGYKNLTKMQKLLYIYLRDLCGEDGTCYRSLRALQKETDFSLGYLSENIPLLHNEGLIHAEMRKPSGTHWEVWHITIVDIWEKNAAYLKEEKDKCSPDEQIVDEYVHGVNRSVHQMNRLGESVHEVNESVHAMILNKNHTENQLTKNKEKEDSVAASADDTHMPQKNENDNQPQKLLIAHEKAKTEEINNVTPITQAPSASKRKVEVPTGPLEMPSDDAKWCDETAVQIIEVKKGRRYGEATRRQELTRAKEALRYQIDGQKITREQYILAWDNMCEWSLWTEKKIEPMIRHLLKDDRIVTLIQQKPKSVPNNGPKPRASVLVSEQQAEKNRARYFANREEKEAAYEAQKAKFQGKSRAIGE